MESEQSPHFSCWFSLSRPAFERNIRRLSGAQWAHRTKVTINNELYQMSSVWTNTTKWNPKQSFILRLSNMCASYVRCIFRLLLIFFAMYMYHLYSIQINCYWFDSIASGRLADVAASHFSLNFNKNFDQIYIHWVKWNTISSFALLLKAHGNAQRQLQMNHFGFCDKLFYLTQWNCFCWIWFDFGRTRQAIWEPSKSWGKKGARVKNHRSHQICAHTFDMPTMRAVCLAVRDHFIWPDWIMSVWNPWIQNKSNKAVNWNEYKIDLMTLLFPALFPISTAFSSTLYVSVCARALQFDDETIRKEWNNMAKNEYQNAIMIWRWSNISRNFNFLFVSGQHVWRIAELIAIWISDGIR